MNQEEALLLAVIRVKTKIDQSLTAFREICSCPGSVASIDDFVVTSAHLGIFETTISNYNENLMQYMTPQSVLCFVRSQVGRFLLFH